jgi:hypothetical protein
VLRRNSPKRLAFSNLDRLVFARLYRIAPRVANALVIVEPETVIVAWSTSGAPWMPRAKCLMGPDQAEQAGGDLSKNAPSLQGIGHADVA